MRLRSIELKVPNIAAASAFLTDVWGVADAGASEQTRYLTGSGGHPYLVSLTEADAPSIRCVTFSAGREDIDLIAARARAEGAPVQSTTSDDPGGGQGILVQAPEGEVFRFLHSDSTITAPQGRDLPVKLTHVVMNAADAEASADFAERVLGFRVSDRTRGMVFVRCNASHHSIAFARAGFSSLNHIAFEMQDLDAVMRGIGRLRDAGASPDWGPGRHGPGANVFAYYIAPFGAVVEFSTAVETIDDHYRVGAPDDWTWPENRIDQWGMSDKRVEALRNAERIFRFAPIA